MNIPPLSNAARLSLYALTATTVATSIHHVYRFGAGLLLPALLLVALPFALVWWADRARSPLARSVYGVFAAFVIVWLGFVDGGLDHTLRLVNDAVISPLFGTPLAVDLRMLPPTPLVGDAFYEATGVISFLASLPAAWYTVAFVRRRGATQARVAVA